MQRDASYETRQRWARLLTIGVAFVVVVGWAVGFFGSAVAGSGEQRQDPEASEKSLGALLQQAKDDAKDKSAMLRQQWDQTWSQIKQQQSFAQYIKENVHKETQ